jgi:hypothetical protein
MAKRQQSSIDRLPDDVREQLQALLRDPRVTQLEATARINRILEADGHPERLSKSAVNRYAVRMEEVGAKIREAREVSRMWIGKLGSEPAGEVGKLLNEMVRALAFDLTSSLYEGAEPIDPKVLKNLAISVHRLEQAAERNVRLEREIRKQAIEDVTRTVEDAEKAGGPVTAERLRAVLKEAYGV